MKRVALNIMSIIIIGIGTLYLSQSTYAITVHPNATCTENGKRLEGKCCVINDSGHCECWDC